MKKGDGPFEVEIDTLGFFVHRTFYMMVKMLNRELKMRNLALQHSDFAILMVLKEIGSASQSQLSYLQGKERSGVSRSLAALEKEGYIERKPLNGKTNCVTLTEKGMNIMPLLTDVANHITESALKGFSIKNKESIIKNLNKIYQNALLFLDRK